MTSQSSDPGVTGTKLNRRKVHGGTPLRRAAERDQRHSQVMTTKVSLQIPEGLPFDEWERAGHQLTGIVNSSSWWLGDWLVYGKENYVDRYEYGIRAVGLQYQTLRNYAWVAGRFELPRRRAALSFQHHAEVASLPGEEQDRWLDQAEKLKWTTKQLREAIRAAREGARREVKQSESTRRLAVPDSHFEQWAEAAAHCGTDLRQWVFVTLNREADRLLEEHRE